MEANPAVKPVVNGYQSVAPLSSNGHGASGTLCSDRSAVKGSARRRLLGRDRHFESLSSELKQDDDSQQQQCG